MNPRFWLYALFTLMFGWSLGGSTVSAQFIMMPDSTNNRLVLFDPFDGSVVNSNLFGLGGGTPIHAMQVGNEIWVSEQVGDRVSRWAFDGTLLGQIGGGPTGGLDNIRGMGRVGNTIYVTNAATGNTAPGIGLVMYDTNGVFQGFFATPNAPSPFGVLDHQGHLLVSSSSANDDIHRYSYTGTSLGTFHNSTALNFVEQMDFAPNGDVWAAGFSSNNVARLDPDTGALLSSFTASGARGVFQLGNGNVLWTNGSGAHIFDGASSTQIYTGGGRYLDFVDFTPIPEPATLAVAGGTIIVGLATLHRQRRRRRRPSAKTAL